MSAGTNSAGSWTWPSAAGECLQDGGLWEGGGFHRTGFPPAEGREERALVVRERARQAASGVGLNITE